MCKSVGMKGKVKVVESLKKSLLLNKIDHPCHFLFCVKEY